MNLPNKLSLLRICLVPVFAVLYYLPFAFAPFVAVGVFVLAALTDFLDGYIARKHHLVTDLGKLLDPIADKFLVTCALFLITSTNVLRGGVLPHSEIFLAVCSALIVARELLVSAVRQIAAAKGTVIAANVFGKVKTVTQDIALPLLILLKASEFDVYSPTVFTLLWWCALTLFALATLFTLLSGVIYLVQNKKVFTGDVHD